jgi:hypothetical protein
MPPQTAIIQLCGLAWAPEMSALLQPKRKGDEQPAYGHGISADYPKRERA